MYGLRVTVCIILLLFIVSGVYLSLEGSVVAGLFIAFVFIWQLVDLLLDSRKRRL